jgi:GNAT superfamily N-acetyltransferase
VTLKFRDATLDDVGAIAALQNAAAGALTARFGPGPWSSLVNERGAALAQRHARVRVGRDGKRILTVLRLATKKPWAIDASYFTPVRRPVYLTWMAVSVTHQGQGLGSLALADACAIAAEWPAGAVRLDAYDANAGAGGFYAHCGFTERGRVVYKGTHWSTMSACWGSRARKQVLVLRVVLAPVLTLSGCLGARSEADRTAQRLVQALHTRDSTVFAALAVFDFFILSARPTKVARLFVDARLGVWTPAVYACLKDRAAEQAHAADGASALRNAG